MQAYYEAQFEREMGCTEAEWLRWLPQAIGEYSWKHQGNTVGVRIGDGALGLHWQVLEPRVLGLARMPRMQVRFRFAGISDEVRQQFMRRFDLYMQRGGG